MAQKEQSVQTPDQAALDAIYATAPDPIDDVLSSARTVTMGTRVRTAAVLAAVAVAAGACDLGVSTVAASSDKTRTPSASPTPSEIAAEKAAIENWLNGNTEGFSSFKSRNGSDVTPGGVYEYMDMYVKPTKNLHDAKMLRDNPVALYRDKYNHEEIFGVINKDGKRGFIVVDYTKADIVFIDNPFGGTKLNGSPTLQDKEQLLDVLNQTHGTVFLDMVWYAPVTDPKTGKELTPPADTKALGDFINGDGLANSYVGTSMAQLSKLGAFALNGSFQFPYPDKNS